VDVGTLADALGVTAGTIRKWANQGIIPALRISPKVLRFDLAEVLQTLRQRTQTTPHLQESQA
jgi:DNA-binding transcriptional MerR regulator